MLICRLPDQLELACEQLRKNDLCVICVDVAQSNTREEARLKIRQALSKVFAMAWNINDESIRLHTEKGQAPYAVIGGGAQRRNYYLSIAHEGKYAIAAISGVGPVGVDLVKVVSPFEWKDTAILYLGKNFLQDIAIKPIEQQFATFLQAWASYEARLKCLGLGLQEWSEKLEQQLQLVHSEVAYVSWDAAYITAVARLQSDKHNPAIQKSQFQN
ncbi:MAG: 4'-phosphopantetheinyl transferase superfamily protein [Candidatus Aquirickettsiella gammari]